LKKIALFLIVLFLVGCGKSQTPAKPVDVAGQKVYELRGKILSRDRSDNTIKVDHEEIKGFMEAMTMDYTVRGAKVDQLPPDGTRVQAKLHVVDDGFWLSSVYPDRSEGSAVTPRDTIRPTQPARSP
jgi:protein SCO1/2